MLAYLFPGQGAQTAGFLHRLPTDPAVAATLAEASDALGIDVSTLDTEQALRSTVAVQITVVTAGVAFARALEAQGILPDAVAGLSVGAYTAAVACGAIAFDAALRLVRRRAELMEAAYPSGYGLVAVLGLTESEVEALVALAARKGSRVYLAIINAPRQIVVAGDDAALAIFARQALQAGARKAERLEVGVPSHCELLADAASELTALSGAVPMSRPRAVYVDNRGGRPLRGAAAIRDDLATNMRYPVRWFDAVTVLFEMGARVFVEPPPGDVLSAIVRDAFPCASALSANGSDVVNFAALVRARQSRAV